MKDSTLFAWEAARKFCDLRIAERKKEIRGLKSLKEASLKPFLTFDNPKPKRTNRK